MNELTVPTEQQSPSAFEMKPRTFEEAMKFCEIMANSDLVPAGYKGKPGNILVACQMGHELGMTPMRALRSIAVVNGRATLWGDDMLAMVLASPVCEYVNESESTDKAGICKVKRKGGVEHVSTFTLEDAKRAGLLGKQGPWTQHTGRMLKLRARGFALRDVFADVLAGLVTTEEAMDITPAGPTPTETPKPTLKDRLKEKLEIVEAPAETPAEPHTETDNLPVETDNGPSELAIFDHQLKNCDRTNQAINDIWKTIPDHLRQDLYACYSQQLKGLKGK